MVNVIDPTRDELERELRIFRRGEGEPSVERLSDLFHLVDALGEGIPQRAFDELEGFRERYGRDPETAIGTYFYLSGWGVGLDSVNQRRNKYVDQFPCDISTAWRRSQRGVEQLASLIRDGDEHSRPWAFVSIFQSGKTFQPFLDFNLGVESWQPPGVVLNGVQQAIEFHVHRDPSSEDRLTRRIVLPVTDLDLGAKFAAPMATLRVHWPMPVWPVWNVASWTADPRIMTRMRTFRQRAVEISLEWFSKSPPEGTKGLVTDAGIWADRAETTLMSLPPGWRIG